ncbi:MAG: hypothetical protein KAR56_02730, partial [Thermoplasmata archaeon]|nr:hypothetical protein [Thermoplasmata archaeon]
MNKPNASISVILALLMIATPLAAMPFVAGETGAPVQTPMFTGGDGSIGDPYWIVNVSDLQNMSLELDAHYKLVNDIDASNTSVAGHWVNNGGAGFLPVGTIALQFTGNLEGNGFTITNLFINRPGPDYIGLFGAITGANGNIKNVTLAKVNITGNDYTGALVGWSDALGAIENCHVEGTVLGDNDVGGMMGYNQNGPVTYCSADVDVTMDSGGGGLIAWNDQATITSCFATGDVTGLVNSYGYGGLVGYNQDSVITKCYATGDVSAAYRVGGLVGTHGGGAGDIISQSYATGNVTGTQEQIGGFVGWNNWAYIENCYSTGAVNGNIYVGGFAGHNREAHITNCYSTGLVTGNVGVGGFCGWDGTMFNVITSCYYDNQTSGQITSQNSTGHTTTDMLNNFTYTDAGWDFDNVWFSVNGSTRPFLQMEHDTTIKNSHQLQLMQMNLTADYTLANDIDLSDITNPASMWGTSLVGGEGFYSIGTSTDRFHGSLDGQGHIIADLFINRPSTDYIGLFGYMEFAGTTLTNIGLINNNVTGSYYVGGLVAHSIGGPVTNCYTTGTSTAINNWVGGLVGRNDAPLTNCYATGNVSGAGSVGGLTGYNYYGEILNCYATGDISGTGDDVGGLIGDNRNIVSNCYATGNVIGNDYVGGLTGYASAGSGIDISNINNCSSFGNVDGHSYVAGITGWTDVNTMFNDTHSFGTVTGSSYLGGLVGRAAGGSGIISNSTASGNIIGTSFYVGGLVGMSYHDIRDSIASGDVSGSSSTGGLVGRSDGALIDCTAYGNATGTGDRIGGLVGDANAGSIMDCIAHGNVEGANRIGGLIGQNSRPVAGSEAYGNVTADRSDNVGGLIGYNTGTVDDCRADSYVMNDGNNTGGLIGYNNGPVSNSTSFGDVYNPRTIDFDIESTGGLIGEMAGSTVSFCEAYGNVTGNEIYTGGLIGYIAIGATVTNSSAYGITNASGIYIGGLVGMNEGTIIHCSAHGVTGDAGNVKPWTGGLVGRNYINGLIQNSSAFGDVFGSSITGGLVGENRGIIERSYSTGDVIATSNRVGGFVGWNIGFSFGDITDCYSQGNATGGNNDEIGGF